jgi:putative membrane protein
MKNIVRFFLTGICMGAADVVPGVSGGTVAFILGIYHRLVTGISRTPRALRRFLKHRSVLRGLREIDLELFIPLCLGILLAIFTAAKYIHFLMENHPTPTWSFFFGLILSSAILIGQSVKAWSLLSALFLLIGIACGLGISMLTPSDGSEHVFLVFGSGMLAITAMILPGISGSFILLVLGQYKVILEAVHRFNFWVLVPFAFGCGLGLLLFSRVLEFLLNRYHSFTMAWMTGLMLGSLRNIWPFENAWPNLSLPSHQGSLMVFLLAMALVFSAHLVQFFRQRNRA